MIPLASRSSLHYMKIPVHNISAMFTSNIPKIHLRLGLSPDISPTNLYYIRASLHWFYRPLPEIIWRIFVINPSTFPPVDFQCSSDVLLSSFHVPFWNVSPFVHFTFRYTFYIWVQPYWCSFTDGAVSSKPPRIQNSGKGIRIK